MFKWSQNHEFDESKLFCQTVKFQDLFKTWPINIHFNYTVLSIFFKKIHWYLFNKKILYNYTGNYFSIKNRRKCVVNLWNWFYQNRSEFETQKNKDTYKYHCQLCKTNHFLNLTVKSILSRFQTDYWSWFMIQSFSGEKKI